MTDWTRLTWEATKRRTPGAKTHLISALRSAFPGALESAKAKADRRAQKTGRGYVVAFFPNLAREIAKAQRPAKKPHWWPAHEPWEGSYSASPEARASLRAFQEKQAWPFSVEREAGIERRLRVNFPGVVVYTTHGRTGGEFARDRRRSRPRRSR